MIYFVYLFVLLILLILERTNKYMSKLCRIHIPVFYTLLIGFRAKNIGVDTNTYYDHYYKFGRWGCDFVEYGFDWINRYCFSMGWEANSLFLIMASVTCLFLYLSLERFKSKDYTIVAFFIYLFTFSFLVNGMRQGVAVAVFLYAYKFIEERQWKCYVISIFFGSLFHASVLLLLPLYFLNQFHLPGRLYLIFYILSFFGVFIDLSPYLPEIELGNRDYSQYTEEISKSSASSLGFIVTTTLNAIVFYLMLKNKLFEKVPILTNLVFAAFCLKNLGFSLPIIGRVTIYFSWFVFLLYPYIAYSCRLYLFRSRTITILLIFLINVVVWLNSLYSEANKLLPYSFYWE